MKTFWQIFLIIFFIIAFIIFYKKLPYFTDRVPQGSVGAEYMILDVTVISGWHNGRKQWTLYAKKISVSRDERFTYFDNITKGIIFSENKPLLTIYAKKATYDKITKNLQIFGKIKVRSKDFKVETTSANWDGIKQILNCKNKTKISFVKGDIILANNFFVDAKNEILELKNGVYGVFKFKEEEVSEVIPF